MRNRLCIQLCNLWTVDPAYVHAFQPAGSDRPPHHLLKTKWIEQFTLLYKHTKPYLVQPLPLHLLPLCASFSRLLLTRGDLWPVLLEVLVADSIALARSRSRSNPSHSTLTLASQALVLLNTVHKTRQHKGQANCPHPIRNWTDQMCKGTAWYTDNVS